MRRLLPRRLGRTTVFRLALTYAGLYALITAIVLVSVYGFARAYIDTQIDADIKTESDALVALRGDHGFAALEEAVAQRSSPRGRYFSSVPESGTHYYLLLDATGRWRAGKLPAWPAGAAQPETWLTYTISAQAADRAGMKRPADFGATQPLRVRGLARRLSDGSRLLIVETLDEASELSNYILISLLAAIGLILIFGFAGGVWMGRHVVARLESVRSAAADIMAGELSRRIPVAPRDDEFSELATTLNAMLTRIEALMNSLRQVTDNVAHDLRSPLNRLRSRLDVTLRQAREASEYRAAMEQAIADADDLLRTFNAMLQLAELESGTTRGRMENIAFDAVCIDVISIYEPLAESRRIALTSRLSPLTVRGNRTLLAQAVGNLLDNALKYTPGNGKVHVEMTSTGDRVSLMVADSGPGIPAADRERVLDRFVRLDDSRSLPGNGLGLSLVRAIVQMHGGRIELADNRPGLVARIELRRKNLHPRPSPRRG